MLWDLLTIAKCQRLLQEDALDVVLAKINEFYAQWSGAFTVQYTSEEAGSDHFGPAYIKQLLNGGHFTVTETQRQQQQQAGANGGSQLCRLTNRLLPMSDLTLVYYQPCLHKILAWEQSTADINDERPYIDSRTIRNCLEPKSVASRMNVLENNASSKNNSAYAKRKRLGLVDPTEERLVQLHQRLRSEEGPMYISREYSSELTTYCVMSMAVLEFLAYPETLQKKTPTPT